MLRLKRVEVHGFKSFPERAELRFHGTGIAAIVGPNGCGKSNLADAINWVLGEQSAKTLRGARMEDVIFAGTRERKPVGLAAVTLTLVEPAVYIEQVVGPAKTNGAPKVNGSGAPSASPWNGKDLAEKATEITVTRRLFRSGESEYLINGRAARLRDIQDIFMGTGLGPESYAIIEQGRIGQLLSSRPQDRRAVIEEAAGVSKFKSRRRLAEARLEGAKHNLERVFDILEEVGRQANSLKRQAAKARRYEELRKEMGAQLRRVLAFRYQMLERETAKIALDLNLASAGLQSLAGEVASKENTYSRSQAESYQKEAQLTDARKRLAEFELELERTRGRLAAQTQQIGSLEQRLEQGQAESEELGARAEGFGRECSAERESLEELESQTGAARARLEAQNRRREELRVSVEQRERAMEASRQLVLRLLGETSELTNQLAQIDEYLAALDRDLVKVEKEEETAAADLEWLGASKQELSQKLAAQQLEFESIAEQRRRIEEDLALRKTETARARRELETARAEFSEIKARRDSLEEILSHRAYATESVKRFFTALERGQAQNLKPAGVLADFVEVEPAYEKAVEEFLHDELDYIVVRDWAQAESGIELMLTGVDGRATFLVHPEPGSAAPKPQQAEPQVSSDSGAVARLSDVLRLTNGLSSSAVECLPRLARCFLAADRAAAQRLALQYPHLCFLLRDGVCYHGHTVSGGQKTSSGPLALKRELREAKAQVLARQKQLDETGARIHRLEAETQGLEAGLERLRGVQQAHEKETLALDHEMRKLAEEISRAAARLSVARLERERLMREEERSLAQREHNQQAVEARERKRLEQEEALESGRTQLEALKLEAARTGEEHATLRAELAGLEERWRAGRTALARLETQFEELTARRQEIAAELERQGAERARLLADNLALDQRSAAVAREISQAENEVSRLAGEEAQLRAELAGLEETLKQLRLDLQAAQEQRAQIEVELVKRQAELRFLDETSRKELNCAAQELVAGAEELALDEQALTEADQRYQEIRARIEALGPVNPQALEEYREAHQRYEFLNTQRQDLLDSIRDTEKAIHEIDVESRRRFTEAFAAINANFRELFVTLFGGGTGEMRLTDEENVNESGIDIVASPPGKRLQSVLLLSGGEKALTALALLMGIFKYQPSPFCVLDEVDAPLDDANIQRFTRLLEEMSQHTQFIIITHAKRTMEAAQVLYGVTMQEPGVSKLVSVKFQPPPPAAVDAPVAEVVRM